MAHHFVEPHVLVELLAAVAQAAPAGARRRVVIVVVEQAGRGQLIVMKRHGPDLFTLNRRKRQSTAAVVIRGRRAEWIGAGLYYLRGKQNGHGRVCSWPVGEWLRGTVSRQAHSAATTEHHCCQGHGWFYRLSLARAPPFWIVCKSSELTDGSLARRGIGCQEY